VPNFQTAPSMGVYPP